MAWVAVRAEQLFWQVSGSTHTWKLSVTTSATLAILLAAAATKLLWMKRNEPENFDRLAHVLLPHDYINWWLTGRLAMEVGSRCCSCKVFL